MRSVNGLHDQMAFQSPARAAYTGARRGCNLTARPTYLAKGASA